MDKIKVNNQVVLMRKFVKQAKIHTINKCTKQIKFLENRKGNEEQMAKTKRKLQRLLEEVTILKKTKPDLVSKLALSKAKDWKAVLAEKNVPLEDRCLAMLANHPPVQEAVEKFHKDNSELIPKIPDLLKQWEEKKSRSSQISKKKQKGSENNATGSNTLPIGNKNFHKSNKAQIKLQSTESLESLPDSSDLKIIQSSITGRNLEVEKTTKRKDPMIDLSKPAKKKSLIVDDTKCTESDGSLSDSSEFTNHHNSQTEEELPTTNKTQSGPCNNNSKGTKGFIRKSETNSTEEKGLFNDDNDSTKDKVMSNRVENMGKLKDIRSKFLEMSMSKTKVQSKPRNKPSSVVQKLNANVETDSDDEDSADSLRKLDDSDDVSSAQTKPSSPTKLVAKNKIKAVTVLDLNELQNVDEIPIEKSDSDAEDESDDDETDEESGKPKKDPFFLRDGEPVSESDDDEDAEKRTGRKRDLPPFKKKPFDGLNRRERRGNSFPKRREGEDNMFQKGRRRDGRNFEKHSFEGRNSNYRENSFVKNKKELPFKDGKRNFKRTFDGNSDFRQNKKSQIDFKDKFNKRNNGNKFTKNSQDKSFSQNHSRDSKQNNYPSKPSMNQPTKTANDDKPLHPSWEAKKKLKEAATLKFQGKRMVFND